jgi:hypothetical protein
MPEMSSFNYHNVAFAKGDNEVRISCHYSNFHESLWKLPCLMTMLILR